MKKKKEIEIDICDICGGDQLPATCMGCGKVACWDCRKKGEMESFSHGIYFSGSGDGDFCPACLANPPEKIKPLLTAYLRIRALRNEYKATNEDFEKRCKKAEADLETFLD